MKGLLRLGAALLGLLLFLELGVDWIAPQKSMNQLAREEPTVRDILKEPAQTVDLLILGDSESYSAFTPMQLWADTGCTAYVCGTCGQQLCDTEQLLYQAFRTQSPKLVVLETNALYRRVSLRKLACSWLDAALSGLRGQEVLEAEDGTQLISSTGTAAADIWKGFRCNNRVRGGSGGDYMHPTGERAEIPKRNRRYLERIKAFCDAHQARLILVSTPSTVNWSTRRHNGVQALAEELGVTYLDLNLGQVDIDWSTDTRDRGDHLNYYGAVKVTRYLGTYLKTMDVLTDHRTDPAYAGWNWALEEYETAVEEMDG
ncbi:MAG: hypothetical protein ACI3VN_08765 [Candidatus Onthomonas sp.]